MPNDVVVQAPQKCVRCFVARRHSELNVWMWEKGNVMCLQNTAGFSVDAWRHQRRAQMRRQTYPKTYQQKQKWNCVCVEFYAFFGSLGITPSRNLRRRFCNNKHNSTVVMDLHFTWKNWCLDVMLFGNALFGRNWVSIFQNQVQRFISLNICHSCCQLDTTL